ncbi:uncharacterized protein LOC112516227 [Cynara cardunculus var. scolymus]|uniref:uncharacterized protein LOC112516227 n=1 Tax=Cynara cardunculus var. scolymus TaxID=59895 RepID=UPI000D6274AD|nr:uncharacterized protein LOC112516227 [Cynara cardunculus var. scolymus]
MEKYLKRKASSSTGNNDASNNVIDVNDLPWDPSERTKIIIYNPNQRDEIRRQYLVRGPFQPRGHIFPTKVIGAKGRRFVVTWFDQFQWLEYSVKVDRAYCLPCYLFRDQGGNHGIEAFVAEGFNSWSKKDRLMHHEGEVNSFHHKALKKCEDLVNQNQSIVIALRKQTELMKTEYHMRLNAPVEVCRYLLENALRFRGNNESEKSMYKGLFLGTLKLIGRTNGETEKVILQNAPKNNQLTSPKIQKDLVTCFAEEVLKGVIGEIGDDVFALLVDESSDVSRKEQMAVVLRFVDKVGVVQERFVFKKDFSAFFMSWIHLLKDEDILEAIDLIGTTKGQLQMLRENGFDQVLEKCYSFCDKHKIVKLDMAEAYVNTKSSRKRMNINNQHYYNYDIFNTVLDMQIREFGDRFGEISSDLLQNMAALNPRNSFSQFNKSSLLKLSHMYPRDFEDKERIILEHELDIYYHSVYNDVRFANLNGIADLARLMVATRKHLSHPLVYRLLKLTLVFLLQLLLLKDAFRR